MLERITNFMAHPETLLPMSQIDDPVERFVSVVKFYLNLAPSPQVELLLHGPGTQYTNRRHAEAPE
ncbi:hypothetical protein FQN50_006556 [Emmonsiellopsis sp. PD_5]|nr:hypothetical protein FQN50_006556 [Emmonsiellopsis sp. PD_5]